MREAAVAVAHRPGAREKRRTILDAAVRVFAREGFTRCRVSDIADEAQVAYGLVYHYFDSKDEILDTLFRERWGSLLAAVGEIERESLRPREKLYSVAAFIIDSYRRDPDLMKVIIVDVTRAANTFGRAHLAEIEEAYRGIERIVKEAQHSGEFRSDIPAYFAALNFYGALEQLLSGWVFGSTPETDEFFENAKGWVVEVICGGLEAEVNSR